MRASNKLAREWLLSNGFDEIWFKRHTRKPDRFYTKDLHLVKERGIMVQRPYYYGIDLWNLFDGICFDTETHSVVFFQVKTNNWPNPKAYKQFKYLSIVILFINVKKVKNKWVVETRTL